MNTHINNKYPPINLGAIDASTWNVIISAVAKLIPVIINMFGGNKDKDPWNSWDVAGRREFVRKGLEIATEQYINGNVSSIDQAMAIIIGEVETNETYQTWKNADSNAEYAAMVNQAQINADSQKNSSLASIISTKSLLWVLGFSVLGFGFYWFKFREKPEKQPQELITTKKLT